MRVAVIADVHGNSLALAAVLAAIAPLGADLLIELGDAASGPLWPAETMELLERSGAVAVRGNHDRVLDVESDTGLGLTDAFAWPRLTPRQRAALGARPASWRGSDILATHALPQDDLSYLLHEATPHGVRERRPDEVAALLPAPDGETLVLTAHTHRAHQALLPDGRLVVNPGSVGLPAYADGVPVPHRMEAGSPHARWALLEQAHGIWRTEFHATPYDWHAAAAEAARNGRADWAQALAHGTLS